ncbi:MAG: MurR/RpiR family transcriptional regulator [Rhizobiaceae bacterium]
MQNEKDTPLTFDALRQQIRDRFSSLSPHLQRIARASLEEPNQIALSTTSAIAEVLGVQPSTLIRFSKEFGYSGFSDLQRVFRQRLIEGEATTREKVLSDGEAEPRGIEEILDTSVSANIAALKSWRASCDPVEIGKASQMIARANHTYVAGLRRSRPIADYLVYGLLRSERASSLLDFAGGMAGPQVSTIGREDVLVAIAFPPYSQPVVNAVMDAHVSGRAIIAITDEGESPLATRAEAVLLLDADAKAPMQPISGAIGLVQSLLMLLGQYR